MPVPEGVTIEERNISRAGVRGESQTLEYYVRGTDDVDDVEEAIASTVPALFNGLVFDTYDYEPEGDDSLWHVRVQYRPARLLISPPEPGTARFHWTVAGESSKITHPISVISRNRPDAGTAVQYKGIGDDGEELQGTDIIVPVFSFGFEYTIVGASVTAAYILTVANLVGTKNDDTWKGFPAGSVLFTGASGSYELGADSTINFEFAYQANSNQFTIGGYTIGDGGSLVKRGWDYVDVHSRKVADQGVIKMDITQVDILKVYEDGDFDNLGIPWSPS